MLKPNTFKRALYNNQLQIGLWCSLTNNVTAEVVAASGFDWLAIDMEHSPNDLPSVLMQLQVMAAYPLEALVRLPSTDPYLTRQLLDTGARSLVFPCIESAAEAASIVEQTRYPMKGVRGVAGLQRANRYGRVPNYHRNASEDIALVMQIESPAGVKAAAEIAAVDGVDALFVGPSDLAATMDNIGNSSEATVQSAILEVQRAARSVGKAAAILAPVHADARRYIENGFSMVGVGTDQGLLARGCDDLVAMFRSSR